MGGEASGRTEKKKASIGLFSTFCHPLPTRNSIWTLSNIALQDRPEILAKIVVLS